MITCPVCYQEMDHNLRRMTVDCEHCGFVVSELEAVRLNARGPQEAANLKHDFLLAQGWSPYPLLREPL